MDLCGFIVNLKYLNDNHIYKNMKNHSINTKHCFFKIILALIVYMEIIIAARVCVTSF